MRNLAIAALLLLSHAAIAQEQHTIPNELGLSWPGELVYFDINPTNAGAITTATIQEHQRPVQIERTADEALPAYRQHRQAGDG